MSKNNKVKKVKKDIYHNDKILKDTKIKKKNIKKKSKSIEKVIKKDKKDDKYKMIDLCAGTGAFSYAFESTKRVNVVFSNDCEKSSKEMYDINFENSLVLDDICDLKTKKIPKHDILTAGFPCQPFSIAGKRKGFDDDRSNVFWKILDIIKYHKPRIIVLENVKNLKTHDKGNTFKTIVDNLEKEKYNVVHKILNTSEITSIPQNRERIYIVGIKDKNIFNSFDLDFKKKKQKKIKKMLEKGKINDKYYYDDDSNKIQKMVMDAVTEKDSVYQFRRVYVRKNQSNVCPTLTANMGSGGHNVPLILDKKGARKLTPRECFNFQGFPESIQLPNLSDSKLYKLAGNAVSIPVVKLIADRIIDLLDKNKE